MLVAYMRPDMFAELKKGSAETLMLALLEDGPRHGYELGEDDRRSDTAGACPFTSPTSTPRCIASSTPA